LVSIKATNGHAGASITESKTDNTEGLVTTITLDDLVITHFDSLPKSLVIKLDIEGQEINAFKGAKNILQHCDLLFYYEDHGKDKNSEVTSFVLSVLGLLVFFYEEGRKMIPIYSAQEASRLEKRQAVGYNFFACKANSQFLPILWSMVRPKIRRR
jgi:hypothetical protein